MTRDSLISLVYMVLAFLAASWLGLVTAIVVVAVWALTLVRVGRFWLAAVAWMGLAPFALFVQGLPRAAVAGPTFPSHHTLANACVVVSFALAGWAASMELRGQTMGRGLVRLRYLQNRPEGTVPASPPGNSEQHRP